MQHPPHNAAAGTLLVVTDDTVQRGSVNPATNTLMGTLVILASLGGLLGWSIAAPLSSAVVASGTVVVDSNRKLLQHPQGGVIEQIHVRNGDVVRAGDTLITLHNEELVAADASSQQLLFMAEAKRVRLHAERNGETDIDFPRTLRWSAIKEGAMIVHDQLSIFRARRSAFQARLATLYSRRAQTGDAIRGLERQLEQQRERERLTGVELEETRILAEKGFAPRRRLLELERALAQLAGQTAELDSAQREARRAARLSELEIDQTRAAYQETIETELQSLENELFSLREKRRAIAYRLADLEMRAPVDGVVVNLAVHTVGGVVAPGAAVMEIVPLDDPLVVDVHIDPNDIDYVGAGMVADVYLPGAAQRFVPPIRGEVEQVSADLVASEPRQHPSYIARVTLPETTASAEPFRPGLPVEVIIVRGERSLVGVLVEPFARTFLHAFKE